MTASAQVELRVIDVPPILVDAVGAARLLSISRRSLERRMASGRLPRCTRLGRKRLWLYSDLLSWAERECRNNGETRL